MPLVCQSMSINVNNFARGIPERASKEKSMPREAKKACEKEKRAYQRVEAREQIDKNFYHYIIKKDTRLKN